MFHGVCSSHEFSVSGRRKIQLNTHVEREAESFPFTEMNLPLSRV